MVPIFLELAGRAQSRERVLSFLQLESDWHPTLRNASLQDTADHMLLPSTLLPPLSSTSP